MRQRTIEEMFADPRDIFVADLRDEEAYAYDSIREAVSLPLALLQQNKAGLPHDRPVYFLCENGRRAEEVARTLAEEGYEAYAIAGGYYALVRYRLERQQEEESADDATGNAHAAKRKQDIERSIIKTYRKEIWSRFTRAVREYELIKDGDKIAVCISGGKDSTLMAKLFQELLRHGRHNFETVFLVMNPGYNDLNLRVIRENLRLLGIPAHLFDSEIYDVAASVEKNSKSSPCYLCARMRRGALYDHARSLGCNKIALGHHYDDVIETILMGILYGGQYQTMMPKLHSTNFPGMELIRPMYLIREHDIVRWRDFNDLHFIRCACRLTESCDIAGEETLPGIGHKRTEIKRLIATLKERSPYIESNLFKSAENVHLGAVIGYKDKDGVRRHFLDDYDQSEGT